VTLGLGYGLERFRELGVEATEIRLTGGGSNSAAWRQICADVFGAPVVCLQSAEGGALGAAVQAAWQALRADGATGSLDDLAKTVVKLDDSTRAEPRAAATAVHRAQLEQMHRLRAALSGANLL
jgi:xylulokinase